MQLIKTQTLSFEIAQEYIVHLMGICSAKMDQALHDWDADTATAFYARRCELAAELRMLHHGQHRRIAAIHRDYGFLLDQYEQSHALKKESLYEQETMARFNKQIAMAS